MKRIMMTTAAVALSTTAAFAVTDIADIDTDGDNFASMEELLVAYPDFDRNFFDEIDTNGDNRISAQEIYETEAQNILARASATPMEIMADADGDGFVSYEELTMAVPGFSQSDFDELDSNDDNRISAAEMKAPGASALINGETASVTTVDIDTLDTDSDGFLSYAELLVGFPNVPQVEFQDIDSNSDNRISSVELNAPEARTMLNQY